MTVRPVPAALCSGSCFLPGLSSAVWGGFAVLPFEPFLGNKYRMLLKHVPRATRALAENCS